MTDIERLCIRLRARTSLGSRLLNPTGPEAADTIAGLTAELENRRMCLNCGRCAPEGHNRVDPLPACVDPDTGMAGCAFDHTPDEAWQHWAGIAHKQREEIARLVRERQDADLEYKRALDALQEANERLTARIAELGKALSAYDDLKRAFGVLQSQHREKQSFASEQFARADRAEEQLRQAEAMARFYSDPGDYVAPFTGGGGKLYFDCGNAARTFLASLAKEPQT